MFDAGAIEARLVVRLDQFDKDMDRAEGRVRRLTDKVYRVKIAAVFDESSMGRARSMFASLDNALSKDAMSRLRTSPQGSVLGTLNALFSPHPVTGAPSAQQAAQQGLLGKMISGQGGGVGQTTQRNIIRDVIGVNDAQVKAEGARAGREAADAAQRAATEESKRRGGLVTHLIEKTTTEQTRTVTTKSVVRDVLGVDETKAKAEGAKAGKDAADAAAAEATKEGAKRQGLLGGLFAGLRGSIGSRLGSLFGGSGKGGSGGAGGGGGILAGLLGGIGPGILGVGAKTAGIVGVGAAGLGALPGLLGALSPLLAAAPGLAGLGLLLKGSLQNVSPLTQLNSTIQNEQTAGLGATAAGAKQIAAQQQQLAAGFAALPKAQQQMFTAITSIQNAWQNMTASFAPVIAKALTAVANLFNQLLPQLNRFFAASAQLMGPLIGGLGDIAKQLLPLFTSAIQAAIPVIRPLLDGLGSLVAGILPGLITLVKASAPAVNALAQVFGTLGGDLGKMLSIFAPVLSQSSVIFKALFDVIGALFPIIGKLAAIFASALAPVFVQFASVVEALLPFLTTVGKILGALAGAVLNDLVSAFGALAMLLKGVAPSFNVLATALGSVFQVLENSGVFAVFGNALESIVPVLAKLINTLVLGLAPVFPVLITAVAQLATLLAGLLAAGLNNLLTALIPIVGWVAKLITSIIDWLSSNKLLMPILLAVAAVIAGPVVTALVALIAAVGLVASHWKQIWTDVKNWTDDFIKFMVGLFDSLPGPVKAILTTIFDIWKAEWDAIKAYVTILWNVLKAEFKIVFDAIAAIFKVVLDLMTGNWTGAWNAIKAFGIQVWNALKAAGDGIWNAIRNDLGAALNAMKAAWMAVWNAIKGTAIALWNDLKAGLAALMGALLGSWSQGWNQIVGFAKRVPGMIVGALSALAGDMLGVGQNAIGGLLGGIKGALAGIGNWVNNNIVQPVIGAVKHFFGINSPSTVMAEIGGHLVGGLIKGLLTSGKGLGSIVSKVFGSMPEALLHMVEKGILGVAGLPGKAISALKGLGGKALSVLEGLGGDAKDLWTILFGGNGTGVSQWSGVATHVLALLGQPLADLGTVLAQMNTESGGNPTIVNKWDSNWQAGHPSVGLMQVIAGTFDAYAGPFRNVGPFEYGVSVDPLANVYAGLNYAIHAYPDWTAVLGHGHGYAMGTMNAMPGWAWVGERGRELVRFRGGEQVYPAGRIPPGVGSAGEGTVPGTTPGHKRIVITSNPAHVAHLAHLAHLRHLHHLHVLHEEHLDHLEDTGQPLPHTGAGVHRHGKRIVIVGHPRGGGGGGAITPDRFGSGGGSGGAVGGGAPGWVQQLMDKLDRLTSVTAQIPAGVGDEVGAAVGGSAYSASFRARYPRGGA